jgi:GT2 family glycosyltransferase
LRHFARGVRRGGIRPTTDFNPVASTGGTLDVGVAAKMEKDSLDPRVTFTGVVVIGRNEGERLKRCLQSVAGAGQIVYVDSGSSDGSAAWARAAGATVIDLDLRLPFTAARARNAGWRLLVEEAPACEFVQFVDGDCEVSPGWLGAARAFLASHPEVAAVSGRLHERHPERSLYNLLCDMEWDAPSGESSAVGGNAMYRIEALQAVKGYREALIAGEEPELCLRLRREGWRIWRIPEAMALHDAAMTRFSQWWKRTVRSGYAMAEGASLHGAPPWKYNVAQTRRALIWGLALPAATGMLTVLHPAGLALLLLYPLQALRLAMRDGLSRRAVRWRALFLVLGRFPEAQGVLKFWFNRWRRRPGTLIEYK